MNKTIYIVLALCFLSSCSKVNRTKKKITGDWNVLSYSHTTINGLTYIYEPTSSNFQFGDCPDDACSYSFVMQYENQGSPVDFNQSGSYEFIEKNGEYFEMYRNNGLGGVDTIHSARIILITNDDLKAEFGDGNGRHIFVMQK